MSAITRLAPRLFFAGALFASSQAAHAGDSYWVSPAGQAAWSSAKSAAPLALNACCSLQAACASAKAGDTVYLRGGIYTNTVQYSRAFSPANSGEAGPPAKWLTFRNAPDEAPEIMGTDGLRMWGLVLEENNSYVCVDGIRFSHFSDSALIRNNAHHIEVKNCVFRDGGGFQMVESDRGGGSFKSYVSHIWVHHNIFSKLAKGGGLTRGETSKIAEGGDAVRVGYPKGTGHGTPGETEGKNHHITIEDNLIEYAGHACMDHYGTELVVKNNVIHNEPWYPENNVGVKVNFPATNYTNAAYLGLYSHRNYQASDDFHRESTHDLIEGNRLGHAGVNPNNDGSDNMDLACPKNIFRYNSMYNAMDKGLMFKYSAVGNGGSGGISNRVYNNTIYHNGWGHPYFETAKLNVCPTPLAGIHFYHANATCGNIIKNNIVCDSRSVTFPGRGYDITPTKINTLENNFLTSSGDPRFVNPDLSQPTSRTLPDLHLKPDSPAIDKGIHLTQAKGAGAKSATLVVDDALYFQDATWGADLTWGVTLFPDWIAIGTVNNVVQTKAIDYAQNTITLAAPMTWDDKARIWLYKDSSGRRVLYGSAPDLGAYESGVPAEEASPSGNRK